MTVRRRAILLSIAGMFALAGSIFLLFRFGILMRQQRDVPDPSSRASPEQIVRTLTDALDAHDCATARRVWIRGDRDQADSWCDGVVDLADVRIGQPRRVNPRYSGRQAGEQVVDIAVTFDLRWRLFRGTGSLEDGSTPWGYELVRDSPDGAWRIFSQGVG